MGGGVRDLLLGLAPKDFDIATNATPEQIKRLFRNCRLVGRRFRLAHILFGREVIEVATLRGHHSDGDNKTAKANNSGRLLRDNVYGTIDQDAERRDFTVNALYYDISDFSVRSYGGGLKDLQSRTLRLIGDPEQRYKEDPVRMLRAVRFATKLGMTIDAATLAPIKKLSPLLSDIPAARLHEEVLKLFFHGHANSNLDMLHQLGLFKSLMPVIDGAIAENKNHITARMTYKVMQATDDRINADKSVTTAFFYAALFWYPLTRRAEDISNESGLSRYDAYLAAMGDVLEQQCRCVAVPRRHTALTKDIWQLQLRLERSTNGRAFKLFELPKFRAAYDLLLMRAELEGERTQTLANWWREFVDGDENSRKALIKRSDKGSKPRRRRPRRNTKPKLSKQG